MQEAETKAPAEEESQEEDSRDAVELEKSEDADSLDLSQDTLESDSDEADPFGLTDGTAPAAEAAGTVTLNGVAFDTANLHRSADSEKCPQSGAGQCGSCMPG